MSKVVVSDEAEGLLERVAELHARLTDQSISSRRLFPPAAAAS
jgi:hypothetical protein